MEEQYDVIVCGTGLKECILSGLLSVHGKKVLHVDRNGYYGGECASLNLTQLWEKFGVKAALPDKESFGQDRNWNVDLIPKFVMAGGLLVKLLLHSGVTKYLDWRSVEGTFVYQYQEAGWLSAEKFIHKVPASDSEALKSPLMGLLEKNRCRQFFQWVLEVMNGGSVLFAAQNAPVVGSAPRGGIRYNPAGFPAGLSPNSPMRAVYEYFGLQPSTVEFLGHAVALYTNEAYIGQPCIFALDKIYLYMQSLARYGNSPFIYPVYGLGGLPEGFSRLCAIHGGVYMLNTPVDEILLEDGKVKGIRSGDSRAFAPVVLCDPSYVAGSDVVSDSPAEQVVRCICILPGPVPNTADASSCQIIIPQSQLGRKNDIYVAVVSSAHKVAFKGKHIAIVSTTVETNEPEIEIAPALKLLGRIEYKFTSVTPLLAPKPAVHGLFVSKAYDPTSHFELTAIEVLETFRTITGIDLDLDKIPTELHDEDE